MTAQAQHLLTLESGTEVVADIDGRTRQLFGVIESVVKEMVTIRLDEGQPVMRLAPLTGVDLIINVGGSLRRLRTSVAPGQSSARRLRLLRPTGTVGRDRRVNERVDISTALLWSSLTADGKLTQQRRGVARDISVTGLAFETVDTPPGINTIVAISGLTPSQHGILFVQVVGVDDAPSRRLHHVVRCSIRHIDEKARSDHSDLVASLHVDTVTTRDIAL